MLDIFYHPNGVAVLGATAKPRGGFFLLRNTLEGYRGKVYPINPNYEEILGVKCYPTIASIPENFDLLLYFIPAKYLPETIRECAKKGVKGIIIESAGFSEVGPEGKALQDESVRLAREFNIRLWGPNCMGLLDGHTRHVFSFMYQDDWKELMKPGGVSLIVQSGMLSAGFLMSVLERGGMGISKVASIGNKCDVDETELLEYFVNDPNTTVIAAYLESINNGRKFLNIARSTNKPIIVLKAGRSTQGAKAAMSHTASLSGASEIYKGAFRQAGIVQVYDIHELMDLARGFSKTENFHPQSGTAVLTFSGGAGIVTTDLLSDYNLQLAELSSETLSRIKEVFPEWMEPSHPVDLWPAAEKNGIATVYTHCVEAVMKDRAVDSIIVETIASPRTGFEYLKTIAELKKKYGKPIALWMLSVGGKAFQEEARKIAEENGLPEFTEISRCVSFLRGIHEHFKKKKSLGLI
ncbi:MAG: CoA-binding protein [Spirochaetes bacterium]|nr:CoA-binding protein [Spirochaetota bacterium]